MSLLLLFTGAASAPVVVKGYAVASDAAAMGSAASDAPARASTASDAAASGSTASDA